MTNERAQRIVDVPADELAANPIAPPPVDRADQESQLEDALPIEAAATTDDDGPAAALTEASSDLEEAPDAELVEVEPTEEPDETPEADNHGEPDDFVDEDEQAPAAEAIVDSEEDAADEADEDTSEASESLPQLLEALLFVADEPIAPAALGRALDRTPRQVRRGLDELADTLREDGRGVRLQQGPDGAQLVTAPEAANAVELFLGLEANRRLSNAALETLAIIAYRQPVTRHVIEQIRGVSSDGAVATLRARGLIEGIGRAPGPGRPLLFATTQRFLEHFGLERPDELPPLPDDVELPPEGDGAQLPLAAAAAEAPEDGPHTEGDVAAQAELDMDTDATADADDAEAPAMEDAFEDEDVDEVIEDALDTDDEFAPFEDGEELEAMDDDPELEISDDLDDLSRAAGAALSAPAESTDGPSALD